MKNKLITQKSRIIKNWGRLIHAYRNIQIVDLAELDINEILTKCSHLKANRPIKNFTRLVKKWKANS